MNSVAAISQLALIRPDFYQMQIDKPLINISEKVYYMFAL